MPPPSRLKAPLEQLYRDADWARRADLDAIRYPMRYAVPADREIVALLSACMAYGRVDLFGPWIDWALARMGESPHRFVLGFDAAKHGRLFDGFHYRFNRPARSRRVLSLRAARAHRARLARRLLRRGFRPGRWDDRPRARALRRRLRRRGPLPRLPAQSAVLWLQALVPAPVHGWGVQASPPLPPMDGAARAAGLRALDGRAPRGPLDPRGHAHREHGAFDRPHAVGEAATGRWPRRSRHGSGHSIPRIPSSTTSPSATSACPASA